MKCSVCKKEFGTGTHCQNCGVDRVLGLQTITDIITLVIVPNIIHLTMVEVQEQLFAMPVVR